MHARKEMLASCTPSDTETVHKPDPTGTLVSQARYHGLRILKLFTFSGFTIFRDTSTRKQYVCGPGTKS